MKKVKKICIKAGHLSGLVDQTLQTYEVIAHAPALPRAQVAVAAVLEQTVAKLPAEAVAAVRLLARGQMQTWLHLLLAPDQSGWREQGQPWLPDRPLSQCGTRFC